MEIKTFDELTMPDERTLLFNIMKTPEDIARYQQQAIADCDLVPEVPEETHQSFERVRTVYAYGILCYEMFTVADNLAWLLLEQALRERFIAFYDGIIPLVNNNGEEHPLIAPNFDVVAEAFRRGDYRKGSWGLQISSGDTMKFRASLSQLQDWARREHLLDGQRNKTLFDPIFLDRRNSVAHPYYHLLMSFDDSARTIRNLAEIINRLWGHYTPGGRLYPAPLEREILIIAWLETEQGLSSALIYGYLLATFTEPGDWQCIIVRAVSGHDLRDFDAQYERTQFPTDYLWGPGSKEDALAWIAQANPQGDTTTYLDRLFAVRIQNGKVSLARRPEVAIALPKEKQSGKWFLIKADYPSDAFAHVRHIKRGIACDGSVLIGRLELNVTTPNQPISCAVEQLFDGTWNEMVEYLANNCNIIEPTKLLPSVRVPHLDLGVASDIEAD